MEKKFLKIFLILGIIFLYYLLPHLVLAQGFDFAVVPSKLDFELSAGQSQSRTFKLYNKGVDPVTLYGYVEDYWITPDNDFEYFPPGTKEYSSAKWITLSKEKVIVQPGQYEEVTVTVNAPKNIESGGYYAVVFFEARGQSEEKAAAQLKIHGRVGVVILTTVKRTGLEGEILRKGEIKNLIVKTTWRPFIKNFSFDIKNIRQSLRNLKNIQFDFAALFQPQVKATTVFENSGNTYLHCAGLDIFKNTLTGREDEVKLPEMTVLDKSIRNFEAEWENAPFLGRIYLKSILAYKVSADRQEEKVAETVFWIIPWRLIILILIILAIILYIRRKLKKKTEEKSICPHCGKKYKGNPRFCPHCGKPLSENICPACKNPVPQNVKFCPNCGQKIEKTKQKSTKNKAKK